MKAKAEYLFEISWEACNKVGGIYTVIKSKAHRMMEYYSNYFLIGPYLPYQQSPEFVESKPPQEIQEIFDKLNEKNIFCHYGKWLIKGQPHVILIDFGAFMKNKDYILSDLWNDFQIDSLGAGSDYFDPIVWSTAIGVFLEEFNAKFPEKKTIAHFHEWLAGAGLLYLKKKNVKIGKVFTTHATMLGRSISGGGGNLYSMLGKFDPKEKAYEYGVQNKFLIEKACAQNADCFTTVSEITGIEAEFILGRKPDVIVPNGLDMDLFPSYEDVAVLHKEKRAKLKEMITFHFFPYQSFDIDETFVYYIFGRYEYKNKGIDIFIRSLAQINERLKQEQSKRTIIAYFWIPSWTKSIKQELLENKSYFNEINMTVNEYLVSIKEKLMADVIAGKDVTKSKLFSTDFLLDTRRESSVFKRRGDPPMCTHNLENEDADAILSECRKNGLTNKKEDRVKVVFHPAYLNGTDGLLDLEYDDAMVAGHLGVYPSYYEPWGYTPLESAVWGVPTITTDLAGFGKWMEEKKKPEDKGVFVLKRMNRSDDDAVKEMADFMYEYSQFTRKQRVERKINAKRLAAMADWKELAVHYIEAHNKAIENN